MSDHDAQLRRSWIANADSWTAAVREQKIESRRVATDAAILEAILEHHPRTVLDLGCGEGWLTRALSEKGVDATGVDASPALVDAARERGGGTFHALAYDELDARLGTFDVIAANFALFDEHLEPLLAKLRTMTKRLVIQTLHPVFIEPPYADGWRIETFAAMEGAWPEPMPWYCRTLGSWVRLFRDTGYTIESLREPVHPERTQPLSIVFVLAS
ncbi:MAG TPA: class I SAM-dependent methyltransferase [Thermoanaerobaculia bacterium]|jgi:SAM-dependent methyltransferase|nr:class I SAM-dependent methyltransferase [Thermoanaerobaculia bacterium]